MLLYFYLTSYQCRKIFAPAYFVYSKIMFCIQLFCCLPLSALMKLFHLVQQPKMPLFMPIQFQGKNPPTFLLSKHPFWHYKTCNARRRKHAKYVYLWKQNSKLSTVSQISQPSPSFYPLPIEIKKIFSEILENKTFRRVD